MSLCGFCNRLSYLKVSLQTINAITLHSFYRSGNEFKVLEELSLKAIHEMLDEWKQTAGKSFDPFDDVRETVHKIMSSLVTNCSCTLSTN